MHDAIGGKHRERVKGDYSLKVDSSRKTKIDGADSLKVGGNRNEDYGGQWSCAVGQSVSIKANMPVIIVVLGIAQFAYARAVDRKGLLH